MKQHLVYEQVNVEENCEVLAIKITCKYNSLIVASLYRPTDNDIDYSLKLANAIERLVRDHPKDVAKSICQILIGHPTVS